ncbi:MAG: hypothetical protein FJ253_04630 [Phycisphaerae bacterium]|nr:hypothetical protein [Phycisphaerae bacterium]
MRITASGARPGSSGSAPSATDTGAEAGWIGDAGALRGWGAFEGAKPEAPDEFCGSLGPFVATGAEIDDGAGAELLVDGADAELVVGASDDCATAGALAASAPITAAARFRRARVSLVVRGMGSSDSSLVPSRGGRPRRALLA